MELDQLRLFVDLVREQSFTKVAALNYITQPAVSLSIKKLEAELDTRLLERTTRKVLVTEEGQILFRYAREILEKVDEAKIVLQERRDRVVGTVRMLAVHSVGLHELPASLKEFIRRYPDVNLHIEYRTSDQIYQSVIDGTYDLGIVAYPEDRQGLVTIPFFEDDLVMICCPEHRLARYDRVPPKELDGEQFIAFSPEIPTGKAVEGILANHDVTVEIRMRCDNIEILKRTVEVGLGVSLVPSFATRHEVRLGTLCAIPLDCERLVRPLAIVHRRGRSLTRPQQAFVDLLKADAGALLHQELAGQERELQTARN